MRKFRKSIDNGTSPAAAAAANGGDEDVVMASPRHPRTSKGPSLPDGLNEEVGSPASVRRRRSRIPSEEDDKLMNFLQSGGGGGNGNGNGNGGPSGKDRLSVGGALGEFEFLSRRQKGKINGAGRGEQLGRPTAAELFSSEVFLPRRFKRRSECRSEPNVEKIRPWAIDGRKEGRKSTERKEMCQGVLQYNLLLPSSPFSR